MDFKTFERLREKYRVFISKAENLINGKNAIAQTNSVWLGRKEIEKILEQTDQEKGGIKVFFGKYDEESVKGFNDPKREKEYIGKLTVIFAASDDNADPTEESQLLNFGKPCPPDCC